jgi:dipeptidyl-peptidase-4
MLVASCLIVLSGSRLFAQEEAKKGPPRLTIERIFQAHEFEAQGASVKWLPDGSGYMTWEDSKETPGGKDLVRYDPATGKQDVLVPAEHLIPPRESSPLHVEDYALSKDGGWLLIFTNSKRVWRRNTRGDYWVLDRGSRELRKLGGDAPSSSLMFAKLSPVGPRAAYVRNNNIFVEDLTGGRITPLTDSKSSEEINGTFDWVYEEEFDLRDGFHWSPDGKSIAYWQLNTEGMSDFPLVETTDSLYPRIIRIKYPKVGERNAACRVGVVSVKGGETLWVPVPADPREHYIAYLEWTDPDHLILQQLDRLQETALIEAVDLKSLAESNSKHPYSPAVGTPSFGSPGGGSAPPRDTSMPRRTLLREHDDAWIDLQDRLWWTDPEREFLWLSERDGWRHVYKVGLGNGTPTLITPGDYDVIQLVGIDKKSARVYFTASPDNATQKYLYRVAYDGKGRERLTPQDQPGTHDYELSPDGRWAVHHYSNANTPPIVELIRLPSHERIKLFTDNAALKKKLEELEPVKTEFFRVDIGDGVTLDGWCMFPPHLDPKAKYPLLVYVYGEPAAQTVVDRWTGGNQLWHRMLAERGYVIMSFDNRGTPAPKGRAWRKSIFRRIGILAPQDQAAAVRAVLTQRPYLDSHRVGVWGWSGGGSMTLHAMFKYPDLYATGISIAAVPNQRLYDTIYQERYMGLPGDNVEGYIQGSPITFAHQLKGNLLIIHGTGDDNVHYQGTETLINELIRHDKPFTMMAYPNRSHAISEGHNTTLHLRHLMTRYLSEKLPPGPSRASKSP